MKKNYISKIQLTAILECMIILINHNEKDYFITLNDTQRKALKTLNKRFKNSINDL